MNKYLQIKSTGENVYYKVYVVAGSWLPVYSVPKTITRPNGKLSIGFGAGFRVFRGVARLKYSPVAGDSSLAKFEEWWGSTNVTYQELVMLDFFNVSYNVALTSDVGPEYLSPVIDGANSYALLPFELQTR